MSVAEMNASSLLDKMKTLPEDVQVKLGYMIEGAALLATSRASVDDPPKSAGGRRKVDGKRRSSVHRSQHIGSGAQYSRNRTICGRNRERQRCSSGHWGRT